MKNHAFFSYCLSFYRINRFTGGSINFFKALLLDFCTPLDAFGQTGGVGQRFQAAPRLF